MPRFAHITRGKAGSQWVRDVLSDPQILAAQGVRSRRPNAWYGMRDFTCELDRSLVAPLVHVSADEWMALKNPADRCVVVLRDPRDAIVSSAFSLAHSHVHDDEIALIRPPMLSLDLRGKLEVAAYVSSTRAPLTLSWAELQPTASVKICRFENLVADEFSAFRSMMDHFGWDVSDGVLRGVIDRNTFTRRSGGRKPGEKDEFSHYRNATPGDWKNYFDRDLARRFEFMGPGYTRRLGYARSDDWWMEQPETLPAPELRHDRDDAASMKDELALVRAELEAVRSAAALLLDRLEPLDVIEPSREPSS